MEGHETRKGQMTIVKTKLKLLPAKNETCARKRGLDPAGLPRKCVNSASVLLGNNKLPLCKRCFEEYQQDAMNVLLEC